ncbi:MAG: response regulator, partial [Butyrivibrio sp.]|nr:response regulator [Butyrivibrio sp.]
FKLLAKKRVDLILLDYMMPEMDGPEVFKKLKEDPLYAYIPVIFLTGVKEKDVVIKTLVDLKPQGYIVKPSKKSELVAKIIDVLG